MKLTSRMKFALMQRFIINVVFLLILVSIGFLYLYKEIQAFEALKTELSEDYDYFAKIQQEGIDFQKLVAELRGSGQLQDNYLRNVFSQVTPQFFTTYFQNTSEESFENFLVMKSAEIDAIKATSEYQRRYTILDDILPVYSPGIKIADNDLTNAEFINSVENLLYQFNLTHSGEIGIQSLTLIENSPTVAVTPDAEQAPQSNDLSENIFMIPLELNIEGMKGNIVNFLHYLSHVGSVTADTSNNTLIIYNDTFLGGAAETQLFTDSRYLGQLKTIESIEFEEYIDSSATQSSDNFISRLRSAGQFRERYRVRMIVNFYVAGYPQYRINQAIEDLREAMQTSLTEMSEGLQRASEAFNQDDNDRVASHRVLARTVSKIKESFQPLMGANVLELNQDDVIELYNDLLRLKTLEGLTRENYTIFMR